MAKSWDKSKVFPGTYMRSRFAGGPQYFREPCRGLGLFCGGKKRWLRKKQKTIQSTYNFIICIAFPIIHLGLLLALYRVGGLGASLDFFIFDQSSWVLCM